MFAVPGWSIAADGPKAEMEAKKPKAEGEGAAPNKRKRATRKKDEAVNGDNVANMWERVMEGKIPKAPKPKSGSEKKRERKAKAKAREEAKPAEEQQKPKEEQHKEEQPKEKQPKEKRTSKLQDESRKPKAKKQKLEVEVEAEAETAPEDDDEEEAWGGLSDDEPSAAPEEEEEEAPPKKKAKKEKREKKSKTDTETASPAKSPAPAKAPVAAPAPAPAPAAPKLTPLQASMRAKLVSARFRHLNETLYTRPSADALQLFTESPEMFSEYHEGFRRQVDVWPENPVDGYIRDIKARGKVKPPSRDPRKQHKQVQETDQIVSLPRTDGTATIADMGCGDARLAEVLTPLAKKLKLSLHSFDLHSPSPLVTRADIANVPLADGAADVVIFCLALMGTNWIDFIEEAYRILRWKGELWVAEIKSRFAGKAALTAAAGSGGRVVEHSVGNRKKQQAVGKKPAKPTAAEVAAEGEDLAIEVDGADDRRNETDLSAFVEALRKRGFVLQAEDMSNRMFVRMLFVKSAPPTKGKGVEAAKAREAAKMAAMGGDRNKKQKRFVWEGKDKEEEEGVDETAILKPCVYKLR